MDCDLSFKVCVRAQRQGDWRLKLATNEFEDICRPLTLCLHFTPWSPVVLSAGGGWTGHALCSRSNYQWESPWASYLTWACPSGAVRGLRWCWVAVQGSSSVFSVKHGFAENENLWKKKKPSAVEKGQNNWKKAAQWRGTFLKRNAVPSVL